MSSTSEHDNASSGKEARLRWKLKDVVVGLAVLLLFFGSVTLALEWLVLMPLWLYLGTTLLTMQAILFAYPITLAKRRGFVVFNWPGWKRIFLEGFVSIPIVVIALILVSVLYYIILYFYPQRADAFTSSYMHEASSLGVSGVIVISLMAIALAPVCEEVFFRWFLHNALRSRLPVSLAAIVQSCLFGALHYGYGAIHIALAFVAGLLLTGVYEWRKTLLTPMLVHAGYNFLASLILLLVVVDQAHRPVLGVTGVDHAQGCEVTQVVPKTSAAQAEIAIGDIITKFNGQPVEGFLHLAETVRLYRVGDEISVVIIRDDRHIQLQVVLQKRPPTR